MEESETDSLDSALRDGIITREQYDILKARQHAERSEQVSDQVRRRLLWVGLLLLAVLVFFLSIAFLTVGQRLLVTGGGLVATLVGAVLLWRDPNKVHLSRGLLGLSMIETMVVLLLARWEGYLNLEAHLSALIAVTVFGALLGIYKNSTWLASPSFVAFYIGFVTVGLPLTPDLYLAALAVSIGAAVLVVGVVWTWRLGGLIRLRDAYMRRAMVFGQLARGHFLLFNLYLLVGLAVLFSRLQIPYDVIGPVTGLMPFLVALVAVLYARSTNDPKLLTVASVVLALDAWFFVFASGNFYVWPVAVLVTAGILIYLGVRRRSRPIVGVS